MERPPVMLEVAAAVMLMMPLERIMPSVMVRPPVDERPVDEMPPEKEEEAAAVLLNITEELNTPPVNVMPSDEARPPAEIPPVKDEVAVEVAVILPRVRRSCIVASPATSKRSWVDVAVRLPRTNSVFPVVVARMPVLLKTSKVMVLPSAPASSVPQTIAPLVSVVSSVQLGRFVLKSLA